jgi:light-regulated signal transduction histidine kinase (bacteriophytochrome)
MSDIDRFEVDLTNCDREPIHLLGAIPPFGFLIVLSRETWRVTNASANLAEWVGLEPAEAVGQGLDEILPPDVFGLIRDHLHGAILSDTTARVFNVKVLPGKLVGDLALHADGNAVFVECERSVADPSVNSSAAAS